MAFLISHYKEDKTVLISRDAFAARSITVSKQSAMTKEWATCVYLAKSNIVVLLLHDGFDRLLLFECNEAEASSFICFVLHGEFDGLHLFR